MPLLSQALPSFLSLVFASSLGLPFWVPWQEIWDFLFLVLLYVWLWPHFGPRNCKNTGRKRKPQGVAFSRSEKQVLLLYQHFSFLCLTAVLLSQGRGRSMVGEAGPKELIGMPPKSPERHPFPIPWAKNKTCWNPYWKHWFFRLYQASTENFLCVGNGKMTKSMPLWTLNSRWFSNLPTVVCICVVPVIWGGAEQDSGLLLA